MREIKFRAWNNKKGEFVWPWPNAFWILGEITVFDMLRQLGLTIEEYYKELVVEQFTGLTDKNGKEIFEGDIVRRPGHPCLSIIRYFTDAWKEFRIMGAFVYDIYAVPGQFYSDGVDTDLIENDGKWGKCANCEVIGNIHENKDLLK